jgi:hypothetical protein
MTNDIHFTKEKKKKKVITPWTWLGSVEAQRNAA